jgi:2-hydroxymuconate-semialdehyde hydrolase
LADRFQCLAPDLVGFGATEHPQNPPTGMRSWMRLWVDQCLALLDARQLEKVHLVGNSMGGAIALYLMLEAPERFERVVLMGPIGTPHKITPELDRLWGFYDDPSVKIFRHIVRWLCTMTFSSPIDRHRATRFEAASRRAAFVQPCSHYARRSSAISSCCAAWISPVLVHAA